MSAEHNPQNALAKNLHLPTDEDLQREETQRQEFLRRVKAGHEGHRDDLARGK